MTAGVQGDHQDLAPQNGEDAEELSQIAKKVWQSFTRCWEWGEGEEG